MNATELAQTTEVMILNLNYDRRAQWEDIWVALLSRRLRFPINLMGYSIVNDDDRIMHSRYMVKIELFIINNAEAKGPNV
jgi:hypothetical protein